MKISNQECKTQARMFFFVRFDQEWNFSIPGPSGLSGQFPSTGLSFYERAISWQMHLSLDLKAFRPLISLMSWEWTNRDAANRHLELPGLFCSKQTRGNPRDACWETSACPAAAGWQAGRAALAGPWKSFCKRMLGKNPWASCRICGKSLPKDSKHSFPVNHHSEG